MSENETEGTAAASAAAGDEIPECCRTAYLATGTPTGIETTIAGIPCYVARPAQKSDKAVFFTTDIFGWTFLNNRLLADTFARDGGVNVFVPDLMNGFVMKYEDVEPIMEPAKTFLQMVAKPFRVIGLIPKVGGFLWSHGDSKVIPQVEAVLKELREGSEGIKKICMIGYCWGGRFTILEAASDLIDGYVVAHPSRVSVPADVEKVKKPGLWLLAGKDMAFSDSVVAQTKEILKRIQIPAEFITYPGTTHGFAVRGDESNPVVVKARAEATAESLKFFNSIFNA